VLVGVDVRRGLGVAVGFGLVVATVVGRGWPVVGACCSAAVVARWVAVERSLWLATCVGAAAAAATRVADGVLGAFVALRVRVGVWAGWAVTVGEVCPVVRVIREAVWFVCGELGSADGS
jgi:hypothetical protein